MPPRPSRPPQQCICGRTFASKGAVIAHENSTHSDSNERSARPFRCTECPHQYDSRRGLLDHIESHHRPENPTGFSCLRCRKKDKFKSSLDKHNRQVHPPTTHVQATGRSSSNRQNVLGHGPSSEKYFQGQSSQNRLAALRNQSSIRDPIDRSRRSDSISGVQGEPSGGHRHSQNSSTGQPRSSRTNSSSSLSNLSSIGAVSDSSWFHDLSED